MGGGAPVPSIDVTPYGGVTNPVVLQLGRPVDFIARAIGLSSPVVSFSLAPTSPPYAGYFIRTGPQTATFVTSLSTPFATARIRVTADASSTLSRTITLDGTGTRSLVVRPQHYTAFTRTGYVMSPNTKQTFALVDEISPNARGVASVQWHLWTNETLNVADQPINGTALLRDVGKARIYAHDTVSNQWADTDIIVEATNEPSIEVTPAVATIASMGVVQFTALVSTGAAVTWRMLSTNSGTVSSSGTYTAPSAAGIYVVQAIPVGGDGLHYGVATIIVQ